MRVHAPTDMEKQTTDMATLPTPPVPKRAMESPQTIATNPKRPTPPVLIIIFARADCASQVLNMVRGARPTLLFIAQDAPRLGRPDDIENCRKAREAVLSAIDWPCTVKTHFQEKNLGAGKGVAEAIRWFFENVEEGIVLEDDDLPDPSFFPYCAELLERYRNDTHVMHIAGYNPLLRSVSKDSYYYSKFMNCWGFATWRRVIRQYDYTLSNWPQLKASGLMHAIFPKWFPRWHFTHEFDMFHGHDCNNWDSQLFYLILSQGGLCINPNVNLVRNIGFGDKATFAQNPWSYHAHRSTEPMRFPMQHPQFELADPRAENEILRKAHHLQPLRYLLVRLATPHLKLILRIARFLRFY